MGVDPFKSYIKALSLILSAFCPLVAPLPLHPRRDFSSFPLWLRKVFPRHTPSPSLFPHPYAAVNPFINTGNPWLLLLLLLHTLQIC